MEAIIDQLNSDLERVKAIESILIARATGSIDLNNIDYVRLRAELIATPRVRELLPDFVRSCRSLDVFWSFIKGKSSGSGSYSERRNIISQAFTPLVDELEGVNNSPGDSVVSGQLTSFDREGVHTIWMKALERRQSDPEGAITIARTLIETVCKRILDEKGIPYTDKEDLPKLYNMTAKQLNLAPDQHSEEPIKAILSGAITVVNGLGTLRNKLSDSHGRGGKPVKPSARHAHLAVNAGGAIATFLVETFYDRQSGS
jgi:Abortive infection C-terminus